MRLSSAFAAATLVALSTAASAQAQSAPEAPVSATAVSCGTAIKEGGTAMDGALCLSGVRDVLQNVTQGVSSAMPDRQFLGLRDGEKSCKRAEGLTQLVGQWVFGRGRFELSEDLKTRPLDGFARADMTNWLHAMSGCFAAVAAKIDTSALPEQAQDAVTTLQNTSVALGALRQR